jgi:hypothetical protein
LKLDNPARTVEVIPPRGRRLPPVFWHLKVATARIASCNSIRAC